ncbi:MAG: sulfate adenylyltransferase subunit 1, partial [Myxococcota bacterium]
GVYDDQLKDATRTSAAGESTVDFARLTDGLRSEREQGITIDVAYRYFSTPRRKFIIADTPGHVQYTRNMATGASTANVALILIDARLGVLEQSRRHGFIAHLLGIPHLVVCVNKMDLIDYDQAGYDAICAEFSQFTSELDFHTVDFVPISALHGVNVVGNDREMVPWYDGHSVLGLLETIEIKGDVNLKDFRFPVQYVIRPDLHYRGFAGQISSGVVRVGDEITVMPSGKTTRVTHIDTYEGEIDEAFAPMSITLRLADEIDISRGDLIVPSGQLPTRARHADAMLVWMSETALDLDKTYLIKHTTRTMRTNVHAVDWLIDLKTLDHLNEPTVLQLNDIGRVQLAVHADLCFDPYRQNRTTGAFILVDSITNNTVAAGMLIGPTDRAEGAEDQTDTTQVSATERRLRLNHGSAVVALSGLQDSERQAAAWAVERRLFDLGVLPAVTSDSRVASALAKAGVVAVLTDGVSPKGALEVALTADDHADLEALANRIVEQLRGAGTL